MSKKILTTPIKAEDLADLKIGDVVYLTGKLITARDCAHTRVVKLGREFPVDIKDGAIFHGGPIMTKDETSPSGWRVVAIGPTTSMRMELFEKEFIETTGDNLFKRNKKLFNERKEPIVEEILPKTAYTD